MNLQRSATAMMEKITASLLLLTICTASCSAANSKTDDAANAYKGYRLVFHDEFDRDGKPDTAVWQFEHGFQRNHEDQFYQEDNAWCEGGNLIIEARKETVENPAYEPANTDWRYNRKYADYTSACLMTKGFKHGRQPSAWMYGRFEVRAKLPCYTGCWPAIWCLGTDEEWPFNGEIDIMEYYPVKSREYLHANVAWGSKDRWVATWNDCLKCVADLEQQDEHWKDKYHVWRMDWDESSIKFYLDNELLNIVNLDSTVNPRTAWYPFDNTNPYRGHYVYLLLNLALGGDNGGSLEHTPFPCRYLIDYVRIYQKEEE